MITAWPWALPTGLRAEGIVIDDPGCCRKTFENYFEVLDQVIAKIIEM